MVTPLCRNYRQACGPRARGYADGIRSSVRQGRHASEMVAAPITGDCVIDLYGNIHAENLKRAQPLAARMRPRTLDEFAGQEHFLGPGPWPILRWGQGYVPTPSRDPVYLYGDVQVGIIPERNLNNGQPSFLAALIASGAPRPGEHAVHIGAGVGYYTAIIARLVGRRGRVTARVSVGLKRTPQSTAPEAVRVQLTDVERWTAQVVG